MINSVSASRVPVGTDDFVAVQRLIHRYADAVVHRDQDQWGSCWADDARWDLGRGRSVNGKAAIVELWASAMAGMAAVVQMVHNGDVWTDAGGGAGDDGAGQIAVAAGRWYIDERYHRSTGEAGILLAHYEDTYVRTAAGWRFSSRFLQIHYHGAPDLSAAFTNTADGLRARGAERA
jgi:hypothetical protein